MFLRYMSALALAVLLSTAAKAADPSPLQPSPSAFPAVSAPVVVAQDGTCANSCQTQHDQCRVATKGSPTCDAERQRCLQACISSKRK